MVPGMRFLSAAHRHVWMPASLWLAGIVASQSPLPIAPLRTPHFELTLLVGRIEGCPVSTRDDQARLHGERLEALCARLHAELGLASPPDAATPWRLVVLDDERLARAAARSVCRRELQGAGVIAGVEGAAVLWLDRGPCRDGALWRLLAHAATQLVVARALPFRQQDELGYGWLAHGMAHRMTTELPEGLADTFVVGDVVMPPARCFGGTFRPAAASLLQRGRLPALADLLVTEARDFDFAQHVAALALVDWLVGTAATPITGPVASVPAAPLASLLAAARRGTRSGDAMVATLGGDLAAIAARWQASVARVGPLALPPVGSGEPERSTAPHPHAALFVYTQEPVRERHRAIVAAALAKRHAAHTSGWQRQGDGPKLAIGPVNQRAGFWHREELVKAIDRTWPFVVVLEYEPNGRPEAYLDCARRARGRADDDGWMLDPSIGFVEHHNAQFVTGGDERFAYLAVPDTPTGGHVAGSEFLHRGRVRWADGSAASLGVVTWFDAPKAATTDDWHSVQMPLVPWRVLDSSPRLGAVAVGGVADPDRELAAWGTTRVLRLPEIPPGLTAGRGRP